MTRPRRTGRTPSLRSVELGLYLLIGGKLVADADNLSDQFIDLVYAAQILPGAKTSWLTMLEEVMTLRGLHRRYYIRQELKKMKTPTLFIWGNNDPSAGQAAVDGQEIYMKGPYRRLDLDGEHWLVTNHAAEITQALLQHLGSN